MKDLPVSELLANKSLICYVFNDENASNKLLDLMCSNNENRTLYFTLWNINLNIKKDNKRYLKRLIYLGFIDDSRITLSTILWKPKNNSWDIWKPSKIRLKPDECRAIVLPRQRLGNEILILMIFKRLELKKNIANYMVRILITKCLIEIKSSLGF